MTDDNIRDLAVARDGSLWVATEGGGILHLKDGRFENFGQKEGLANEFVVAVREDHSGDIWAATNRGLFRRHGAHFQRVDEPLHLRIIAFFALGEGRAGKMYAGGPEGLFCFENGELRRYGPRTEAEVVNQIREAVDGSLWVATNHGLRILAPMLGGIQREQTEISRPDLVSSTYQDRDANTWLGSVGDGLRLLRDGQETAFHAPAVLPDDSISAFLQDREGNLWVGTDDGLVRLTAPTVGLLNRQSGLQDENVATVYSDRHGAIWISTVTGRIYRHFQGQTEAFRLPETAQGLRVRIVFEDHSGTFWFGTSSHGLLRLAHGKFTHFTTAEGLRNNGIQAFAEDQDNHVWIGTTSGISRWDGAGFKNYYLEDGLSYGWVRAIVQDRNGDMLVGTDRGINRIHNARFVADPAFSQLRRDRVWSIYPDSRSSLWLATRGGGLVRVRGGRVSRITTNDGLLSNSIFRPKATAAARWPRSSRSRFALADF